MPKLYTKTGDKGLTGLGNGQRVPKNDSRIECIGDIDELNAAIGLCASATPNATFLHRIQNELFIIGSHLAAPQSKSLPPLPASAIARLESEIDAMDAHLPPLRNFILPGGCELASRLHHARAVCRRAERHVLSIADFPADMLIYLNRLSDWLFISARSANKSAGVSDILWKPTP
ncbi:MAG TPA: cob(I)yrinic acid a,c-diamide adenosyltransferase [Tepidisphaeraceae bacterium]|jgi:cob(I)alamin adenosyltransferase